MRARVVLGLAGVGIGLAVGLWTVRRGRSAAAPLLGDRLLHAIALGREAAASKEAELRTEFGIAPAGSRDPRDHGGGQPPYFQTSPPRQTTTDPVI